MAYITIARGGRDEFTVERSRFIGTAARAESEEAARGFVAAIKKEFHDARHSAAAWVIGEGESAQKVRSSDDGEPGGTAGMPILTVLRTHHVMNAVIVVTRYFGGIKLGTGGLTRAYGEGAKIALAASRLVRVDVLPRLIVTVDYPFLAPLESYFRQKNIRVAQTDYAENVKISVLIEENNLENVKADITDITAARARFEMGGVERVETEM